MEKYIVSKKTGVKFGYNEQLLTRPDLYEVVLRDSKAKSAPKRRGRPKKSEGASDDVDSRGRDNSGA